MPSKQRKTEKRSGLIAVKSIVSIDNFETKGIRPYEILRMLIAVFFAYFPICVTCKALRIEYPIFYIIFPALVIGGVYFLARKIKKTYIKVILYLALFGIYAYRNYEAVIEGVKKIVVRFTNMISYEEEALSALYQEMVATSEEYTLITTVYILVFVILMLSTMEIFNMAFNMLFTMPFYILPYVINAKYDNLAPMLIVVHYMMVFAMFFADEKILEINQEPNRAYSVKGTQAITANVAMWVFGITLATAIVVATIEPYQSYKEDSVFEYIENKIVQISNEIKGWEIFKKGNSANGSGLGSDYLGKNGKVEMSNEQVMRVILDKKLTNSIYLRCNTYGEYSREVKKGVVNNKWLESVEFTNNVGQGAVEAIHDIASRALDEMFLASVPKLKYDIYYKCDSLTTGLPTAYYAKLYKTPARDLVVLPDRLDDSMRIKYEGYFLPADERSIPFYEKISEYVIKYKIYEKERKKYEEHIADEYLYVPKELTRFHEEFGDLEFDSLEECALYIKEYMSDFKYTLSPGKCEEGDFVEDFLFNKKKGYCTYFATAATLMFREFGYPARFVEGYVVKAGYGEKMGNLYKYTVTGNDAHAWCEVYIEGVGWVPFEVTVGSGFDIEGTENSSLPEITTDEETTKEEVTTKEIETTENITTTDVETESSKTPEDETTTDGRGEEISSEETSSNDAEETTKDSSSQGEDEQKESFDFDRLIRWLKLLLVVLLIILLLGVLVARYKMKKQHFEQMLASDDVNEQAAAVKEIFNDFIKLDKIQLPYYELRREHCERILEKYPDFSKVSLMQIIKVVDMSVYADKVRDKETVAIAIDNLKILITMAYAKKNIVDKCIFRYIKCLYLFKK